jgi:hypothetical protein
MKEASQMRSLTCDSYPPVGEDLAQVDLAGVKADAIAGGDDDGLVMEGVVELGQALIGALWAGQRMARAWWGLSVL